MTTEAATQNEVARKCLAFTGTVAFARCKNSRRNLRLTCYSHRHWMFIRTSALALIGLFIGLWQAVPHRATKAEIALAHEAYTQLNLACHYWKLDYWETFPELYVPGGNYKSVWEKIREQPLPTYDAASVARARRLFVERINDVRQRIQDQLAANSAILSAEVKATAQATRQQLETERTSYEILVRGSGLTPGDQARVFKGLFIGTTYTLEKLDAATDAARAALH